MSTYCTDICIENKSLAVVCLIILWIICNHPQLALKANFNICLTVEKSLWWFAGNKAYWHPCIVIFISFSHHPLHYPQCNRVILASVPVLAGPSLDPVALSAHTGLISCEVYTRLLSHLNAWWFSCFDWLVFLVCCWKSFTLQCVLLVLIAWFLCSWVGQGIKHMAYKLAFLLLGCCGGFRFWPYLKALIHCLVLSYNSGWSNRLLWGQRIDIAIW